MTAKEVITWKGMTLMKTLRWAARAHDGRTRGIGVCGCPGYELTTEGEDVGVGRGCDVCSAGVSDSEPCMAISLVGTAGHAESRCEQLRGRTEGRVSAGG